MRFTLALFLAAALIAAACNNSPEAQPPAKPTSVPPQSTTAADTVAPNQPPAASGAGQEPVPDPITHPCVVAEAQYRLALEAGSDACKGDGECACYQGGIGKRSGCGGVLNRESVSKLDEIAKRFREMKCPLTQHCAAWACTPRCDAGHCKR